MRVLLLFILFNPWLLLAQEEEPYNESCDPFYRITPSLIHNPKLSEFSVLKQQKNTDVYEESIFYYPQYYSQKELIQLEKDRHGKDLLRIKRNKQGDTIILVTLQYHYFRYADSALIHTYLIFNKGKLVKTYAVTEDGKPYYISWKLAYNWLFSAYSVLYNNNGWVIGHDLELEKRKHELRYTFDDNGYILSSCEIYADSIRYDTVAFFTYKYSRSYDSLDVYYQHFYKKKEHAFFRFDTNGNCLEKWFYLNDSSTDVYKWIVQRDKSGEITRYAHCSDCKPDFVPTNWQEYDK